MRMNLRTNAWARKYILKKKKKFEKVDAQTGVSCVRGRNGQNCNNLRENMPKITKNADFSVHFFFAEERTGLVCAPLCMDTLRWVGCLLAQ